jgi:hypothetical protein
MPAAAAVRGHAFTVGGETLAKHITVRLEEAENGARLFAISAKGVGHAFPTGDLFRRLVLRVHVGAHVVERVFKRSFRSMHGAAGSIVRAESGDSRLAPEQTVVLDLPRAKPGTPLHWELVYQRVLSVEQQPPFGVDVEDETLLASGDLADHACDSTRRPADDGECATE